MAQVCFKGQELILSSFQYCKAAQFSMYYLHTPVCRSEEFVTLD